MKSDMKILIVGNDNGQVETLADLLRAEPSSSGYALKVCSDMSEGIKSLADTPDVILMDLGDDDAGGLKIVKQMRMATVLTPLVIVTDLEIDEYVQKVMREGADDYLIRVKTDGYLLARTLRHASHRRWAETALARERNLLRTLIDIIPDYIHIKDTESRFLVANKAQASIMCDGNPQELIGKTDADFHSPQAADQYRADEKDVLNGKTMIDREESIVGSDGKKHWSLTTKVPLADSDGKVIGLVGIGRNITDRKQQQEQLDNERNMLRTLIDLLTDYIHVKDTDSRFLIANQAQADLMCNGGPEELIGKTDAEFHSPEAAEQYRLDEMKVFRGETMIDREEPIIDPQGKTHWSLTTKVPLTDSEGRIIGLVGIGRDITQHKLADQALKDSEERFRKLFNEAPVGYHEFDMEGRIIRVNQTEAEILGYSVDEMVGKFIWDFTAEKDSHEVILSKLHGSTPLENAVERLFRRKDDSLVPVLLDEMLLHDSNENISGIRATISDVTELDKTQCALAESEARFRGLFDDAPVGYHEIDIAGRIVRVNHTELRMLGCTEEDMLTRPLWDFIDEENAKKSIMLKLAGAIPPGQAYELTFRKKDGSSLVALITDNLLKDSDGQICGLRAAIEDISAKKRDDEAMRLRTLRDPLTGLDNRRTFVSLAKQQLKLADRKKEKILCVYCDIDDLKSINDEFGFQAGDKALSMAAKVLRDTFRESDIIARIGDDEFVAMAIDASEADQTIIGERICEKIGMMNEKSKEPFKLSIAVGVVMYDPENPCELDKFMNSAENAASEFKKMKKSDSPDGNSNGLSV